MHRVQHPAGGKPKDSQVGKPEGPLGELTAALRPDHAPIQRFLAALAAEFHARRAESRVLEAWTGWTENSRTVLGALHLDHRPKRVSAATRAWRSPFFPLGALDSQASLFVVHTATSFVARVLAFLALQFRTQPAQGSLDVAAGRREFRRLFDRSTWTELGIEGFPAADGFDWWCAEGDGHTDELTQAAEACVGTLATAWSATTPGAALGVDVCRACLTLWVPRELRKRMGEFYTPAWLADHVLSLIWEAEDNPCEAARPRRILDPTCGTGIFVLRALRRLVLEHRARHTPSNVTALREALLACKGFECGLISVHCAAANWCVSIAAVPELVSDVPLPLPFRRQDVLDTTGSFPATAGAQDPEHYDILVGNPPWIGWERLAPEDRARLAPLWKQHGLFTAKGMGSILGSGRKDLALLVTKRAAETWLTGDGRLAFVLPYDLMRLSGAAEAFRAWLGSSDGAAIRCEGIHDFSELRPFPDAGVRVAVMELRRGKVPGIHVPVDRWKPAGSGRRSRFPDGASLDDVKGLCEQTRLRAILDPNHPGAPWRCGDAATLALAGGILGPSAYRARQGVNTGGANAAYWFERVAIGDNGLWKVRNTSAYAGRIPVGVESWMEPDLLRPLLRPRDLDAPTPTPGLWLLFAQDPVTRRGLDEDILRRYPHTWDWLKNHESFLRERAAYRRFYSDGRGAWWSMFDVGAYTLSPWKTVWRRFDTTLRATAVGSHEGHVVLPQETLGFIPCASEEEAWFLAGVLNAASTGQALNVISTPGGKSYATPGMVDRIALPRHRPGDPAHDRIAQLASHRDKTALDRAVADLWESGDRNR